MAPTNLTRLVKPVFGPVVVTLGATLAACGAGGSDADITGKTIRYQVEYSGSPLTGRAHQALVVSYSTKDGPAEQRNVGLPWTTVVGTASPGFTASVKAQFYGYGTIVCRIVADNKLIQEHTSTQEPYPTVECKV